MEDTEDRHHSSTHPSPISIRRNIVASCSDTSANSSQPSTQLRTSSTATAWLWLPTTPATSAALRIFAGENTLLAPRRRTNTDFARNSLLHNNTADTTACRTTNLNTGDLVGHLYKLYRAMLIHEFPRYAISELECLRQRQPLGACSAPTIFAKLWKRGTTRIRFPILELHWQEESPTNWDKLFWTERTIARVYQ